MNEGNNKKEKKETTFRLASSLLLSGNFALFLLKIFVGYKFNSMAVIADGYNSLFDFFYSIIFFVGLHFASKPPDPSHPLGHQRIKPLVGIFIAFAIFFAGIRIVFNAVQRFLAGTRPSFNFLLILVLSIAIVLKFGMYYKLKQMGEAKASPPLLAVARDSLIDVLASIVAFVGVLGAKISWMIDPLAGLLVSAWIFKTGVDIVRENIDYLMGASPPKHIRKEIEATILEYNEVKNIHDVTIYYEGAKINVSVHIEVDARLSLLEAHKIEEKIEEDLLRLKKVNRAFIHVDPIQISS